MGGRVPSIMHHLILMQGYQEGATSVFGVKRRRTTFFGSQLKVPMNAALGRSKAMGIKNGYETKVPAVEKLYIPYLSRQLPKISIKLIRNILFF